MHYEKKICELKDAALGLHVEKVRSLANRWRIYSLLSTDQELVSSLQEIMAEVTRIFPAPDDRAIAIFKILFEIRKAPLERLKK